MNEAELDRIAEQAAELPEPARREFISKACRGDQEAIDSVLKFIEFEPPDTFVADEKRTGLELIGRMLGDYTLIDQIGEGGSSIIYSAVGHDEDMPNFAIKLLRRELPEDSSLVARFSLEQEALKRMNHPNIATLIESGAFEGRPYFVMELVRHGLPITNYCQLMHLSLKDRLRLFESTCDAVIHAHQQGIIHRDIKPTNILIEVDEITKVPTPKLIDFGIAKALEPDDLDSFVQTSHGEFIGTRSYATPEQLKGQLTDSRTDIYALGLILYELLTNRPAVDVSTMPNMDQLQNLICNKQVSRPSRCDRAKNETRIPAAIDWIVLMALEKQPNRRYSTVDAFVEDVRNFRLGKRIRAHPRSFWYNTTRFVVEYPLLTFVLVLLFISLGISIRFAYRANKAEHAATELLIDNKREIRDKSAALKRVASAESKAAANLLKVHKINDALHSVIAPPRELTLDELELSHRARLKRASQEMVEHLAGQPVIEANVRLVLGESLRQYKDLESAIREAQRATTIFRRELGLSHPDTLRAEFLLAQLLPSTGELEKAYDLVQSIIERKRQISDNATMSIAHSQWLLSRICSELGRHAESLSILMSIDPLDLSSDATINSAVKLSLADRFVVLGDNQKATEILQEALKYQRRTLGASHTTTIATQRKLANHHLSMKRAILAESQLRDALSKLRDTRPNHVLVSQLTQDLSGAVNWLGRKREAERLILEALILEQRINGPGKPGNLMSLNKYARFLRNRKAFREAESVARFVFDRLSEKYSDAYPPTASCIETMGSIFEDQADYQHEIYWKTRLFFAQLEYYGWKHEVTISTARKVLEVATLFMGQTLMQNKGLLAIEILLNGREIESRPRQVPIVVEKGETFMIQWMDQSSNIGK